jgi:hypothetical protein
MELLLTLLLAVGGPTDGFGDLFGKDKGTSPTDGYGDLFIKEKESAPTDGYGDLF